MELKLKRIDISNVDELQKVFERSPRYTLNIDGLDSVPEDSAKLALEALPPNILMKDKYVFLVTYKGQNIGAIDLIKGYPTTDIAYIGLLILCEDQQGKGLGRLTYEVLESFILNKLKLGKIQLSYVESNPVGEYWSKLGFYKIGERKPYEGANKSSFSQKMEKELMIFLEPEEYQEKVNSLFKRVKADLEKKLDINRLEHIGASSIKSSVSKGDLDIFLGVESEMLNSTIKNLTRIGFVEKKDTLRTDELCMMTIDRYNHDVAIQVVVNGSEFEDFIKFRDFMISRPDLVEELNTLKRSCEGFTLEEYREVKSAWVENIISKYRI